MGPDAETEGAGGVEDRPPPGRTWGYWTEAKLDLLTRYLDAFTTASKYKARERVYLDAFAGEGRGLSRTTGAEFESSPRLALNIDDPPFTRLRFFEMPGTAMRLDRELRSDYPDRDFKVIAGDCNETIPEELAELRRAGLARAPTFAFLDPDGTELSWLAIEQLAAHKQRASKYKIELWMLFNVPGLMRVLTKDLNALTEDDELLATRVFGTERWTAIHALRIDDEIPPAVAREEFVNLMRWRLEQDLSYRWSHALEIVDLHGRPVYHMVFATDNEAGNNIMTDLYDDALARQPEMRREARDRISGQASLAFDIDEPVPRGIYQYQPPWEPPS